MCPCKLMEKGALDRQTAARELQESANAGNQGEEREEGRKDESQGRKGPLQIILEKTLLCGCGCKCLD